MMITSILALTLVTGQANPDLRVEMRKGYWDARMNLARIGGRDALSQLATRTVRQRETGLYDLTMRAIRHQHRDLRESGYRTEMSYEARSRVAHQDPKLISVIVGSYTFTGGAHGLGTKRTYNFGMVAGKPKHLTLADVVGEANLEKVQVLLLEKIIRNPNTQWADEGWLSTLKPVELNRFWVSKQGMTWEFDPYELASYAAGPFSFMLTWSELRPLLLANSPVGHLAR